MLAWLLRDKHLHIAFADHRDDVRKQMEKQTVLMEQMVKLQANHNNLDTNVNKIDKRLSDNEKQTHSLEVRFGELVKDVRDNKRVVWLIITLCITAGLGLLSGVTK